jgi:hypothetical protein
MGKLTVILLLAITVGPLAATSPPASVGQPARPGSAPVVAPDPNAPPPSRYAGANIEAYVANLTSQFEIRNRATDVFGQFQDPNAKPIVKPAVARKPVRRFTAEPPKPLSSIVSQIEITTVMPKTKRFLVGNRSIAQGENLTLSHRGKQIQTQIMEVSSRQIVFKELETGEIAVRQLKILPQGMTPGTRGITAPGMTPADSNAPLEVGGSSTPFAGDVN